ncbi:MAG: alpha/beta hydrolase domain-containing protein [Bryobacteraceae bacterium]
MIAKRMFLALAVCGALQAAVQDVQLNERFDLAGGKAFGKTGPYETLTGKVYFAVDPKAAANAMIADIELAPRNEAGLVEFAADFYVIKPRDPASGNGTILYEVSNRGNKGLLSMFDRGASGSLDPRTAAALGDSFLLEQGYTLVWLGWQWDVPTDRAEKLRLFAPVVKGISGKVRSEILVDSRTTEHSLADRNHIAYRVTEPATAAMTVRDRCDSERRPVSKDAWKFTGDGTGVIMPAGFEPGLIYEVVYTTTDPVVMGLGPAAVRDFISYLKYGSPAAGRAALGDQRRFLKRAVGFGTSQSGRFLRTFLYYGFNADEAGKQVFDGVWAHVAGAGRGSFNHRFAQPSRDGHPHMNCLYPTDIFPFTDETETDDVTGWSGSILAKAREKNVVPKIFYTNGSYEYWGRAAALIHSSLDGRKDVSLAADTRAYFIAGTQHGAGSFPPNQRTTANPSNVNDYRWHMRALLVAMNAWVSEGKAPPASQIPLAGRDQLVTVGAINWPKIPGSHLPERPQRSWRADYGPEFMTKGIVTEDPPKLGKPFAAVVPQVDRDGNETSGIRAPMLQVPLATLTGWNLRTKEVGAENEIYSMVGSTFRFPRTKAERTRTKDPRPSIEERYKGKDDYLSKYRAAAEKLADDGYLLRSDLEDVVKVGGAYWDWATSAQ